MGAFSKTDNHNLAAKLDLRRALLPKNEPLRVLDCFAGSEAIWKQLRTEFAVEDYLALDVKQRKGRLKLDSARFVAEQTGDFNIIDLDAYGAPWDHFVSVLKWHRPLIVFLTVGAVGMKAQSKTALALAGIPPLTPIGMHSQLHDYITESCLTAPLYHGFTIGRTLEALNPGGSARYFGMQITPVAP